MAIADLLRNIRESEGQQTQNKGRVGSPAPALPSSSLTQAQREKQIAALTTAIQLARTDIETAVTKLQESTMELRALTRRNFDESSQSLIIYSNAHLRMAGAMVQALQRTASMDRVLVRAAQDREDGRQREEEFQRRREAHLKAQEQRKLIEEIRQPTEDDFDAVYGEILNDAS